MPIVSSLDPVRVLDGGRLWLRGEGFPEPELSDNLVTIGGVPARLSFAAHDRLVVVVPAGLDGGETPVKLSWVPGTTLFVRVGALLATGLHIVDNPVVAPDGSVYATYSGVRGQEATVSIFRITSAGAREPFVHGLVNPTSMALGPDGRLYVSSRFDGRVYRVLEDGSFEVLASDLGTPCGLVFGTDGMLYVGDRTGSIFRVDPQGRHERFAVVPPSVAAFHLAMGPDQAIYLTAPTLASQDVVRRIDADGRVEDIDASFGRPQGLAFDPAGVLHVVEALAGSCGVYALRPGARRELVAAGRGLVGLAFDAAGHLLVASADSMYSFAPSIG